jgi:hypothetical protein
MKLLRKGVSCKDTKKEMKNKAKKHQKKEGEK